MVTKLEVYYQWFDPGVERPRNTLSSIADSNQSVYLSGMKRDELVAPIPGRPWATGL